jgi:hypothetical protein
LPTPQLLIEQSVRNVARQSRLPETEKEQRIGKNFSPPDSSNLRHSSAQLPRVSSSLVSGFQFDAAAAGGHDKQWPVSRKIS